MSEGDLETEGKSMSYDDETIKEWAEHRADDAGRLARELMPLRQAMAKIESNRVPIRSGTTLHGFDALGATVPDEVRINGEEFVRKSISQAHLSEAVKVLEPFARYLDEHKFDIDNKGNLLPDETQPGWTYLTAGDFRAAKAFLATIGEESHGG